jgi:thiamine-monophosphate kinase
VDDKTLQDLGEIESLRRCVARLKPSEFAAVGSGDDAAVVASQDFFLVSTDTLVQDHDFKLDWSTGFDLGFKAVASNLADIAAMGAKPTVLVVALVIPKTTTISWLEDFADGLQAACDELSPGTSVVGGDLASGEKMVVAVTVHGTLDGLQPVLRSGAQPGDLVAVCGPLGKAACGLALLLSEKEDLIRSYDDWVSCQLRPQPPIGQGVVANKAGATSMIDVSDGLEMDLTRIARASSVVIEIYMKDLLGFHAMLELPAQALEVSPSPWVLSGGEDHSLLATFPPSAKIPISFKVIGKVLSSGDPSVLIDGTPTAANGWDSVLGLEN